MTSSNKSIIKYVVGGVVAIAALILISMNVGMNDAGQRTVIQYPSGTLSVKFQPGFYFQMFGKTTVYNDYLTYDFTGGDKDCSYKESDGQKVLYLDGGAGVVCGIARIQLPSDESSMIEFHKSYRSEEGVRNKLLRPQFAKALNLTAGMMTSEEGYADRRPEFMQFAEDQAANGVYRTKMTEKTVVVGTDPVTGKQEIQRVNVPEIILKDGIRQRQDSDFEEFGIRVSQFDLMGWDFEQRTIEQIKQKREANMAKITARVEAEKAVFEEKKAEAEGKANVTRAKYSAETEAQRQIVDSERDAEKAVIKAKEQVDVVRQQVEQARQEVLREEQNKLAEVERAEAIKIKADAEAHAKRAILEADNALAQKLEAYVKVQQAYAEAFAKRNVPANVTVLGSGTGQNATGSNDEVQQFLQLQIAKTAKDLALDTSVSKNKQ